MIPSPDFALAVWPEADIRFEPSRLGRYRILHDFELPLSYGYGMHSRTAAPDWPGAPITPETCRISGGASGLTLPTDAQKLVYDKNTPTNEYKYVIGHNGGWVNYGYWPRVEVLTFAGNVVDVTRIEGNKAFIRTWRGETDDPCVIHLWANIGEDDKVYYGGWNGPAWIVLAYVGELWIELDKLKKE
jgi:hypothetical protein